LADVNGSAALDRQAGHSSVRSLIDHVANCSLLAINGNQNLKWHGTFDEFCRSLRACNSARSKRTNQMKTLLIASTALMIAVASPASAQNATSTVSPSATKNLQSGGSQDGGGQNLAAAQKIQQDLKSAGFTDVKVVAESFVVQAKSKDGDPVLMTIGPHGMSVFEAMNSSGTGSSSSTTGSNSGSNSATSSTATTSGSPGSMKK
jgi:hypothetical protein